MVNIQKANACSPWTPCFKIKEASIVTSEDKMKMKSPEIYTHIYFYFEKNVGGSVNRKTKKKSPY